MKSDLENSRFSFEYARSNYTEKTALENGFKLLKATDLYEKIINKTVHGNYPMGFRFISKIFENGKTVGINDVGSKDIGTWRFDFDNNTFHLQWKNGWQNTITRAYEVNGNIEFYDIDTGNWRTTFVRAINFQIE